MADVITVTALNSYVKTLLDRDPVLMDIALRGEISNFTHHYKTGHFYFSLKDEQCAVKAVMFRRDGVRECSHDSSVGAFLASSTQR